MQKVITHDGCFHTDEVLACMLLDVCFDGVDITRTRDEEILESVISKNDEHVILVDVGGVYDGKHFFDHHQYPDENGYVERWSNLYSIPMSSAGMIWKHFGVRIINHIFPKHNLTDEDIEDIWSTMYNKFFLEIDANDNGISQYSRNNNNHKKYGVHTTLIGTIGRFNHIDVYDHDLQFDRFLEAMEFSEKMFIVHLETYVFAKSRERIGGIKMREYYNKRLENGRILVLDDRVIHWRNILRDIEKENNEETVLYIIYPKDDKWGLRTIPKIGFEARKNIADESVIKDRLTNPQDLVFQHKKRFMASFRTKESAIQAAKISLMNDEISDSSGSETTDISEESNKDIKNRDSIYSASYRSKNGTAPGSKKRGEKKTG